MTSAAKYLEALILSEEIQVSPTGVRLLSTASTVLASGGIASFAAILIPVYFPSHPLGHINVSLHAQLSSWSILPGAFPVLVQAGTEHHPKHSKSQLPLQDAQLPTARIFPFPATLPKALSLWQQVVVPYCLQIRRSERGEDGDAASGVSSSALAFIHLWSGQPEENMSLILWLQWLLGWLRGHSFQH